MVNDHGYISIVRWGRFLGSHDYYIQDQCDLAKKENAPLNAIYPNHRHGGRHRPEDRWATTDDVTNPRAREALGI